MDLVARTLAALERLDVRPDGALGVAVSGGADSIALLHLLVEARPDVVVLHVDHGLRPGSSDDAAFVSATASGVGVRAEILTVDVRRTKRSSLEADAREARYAALEEAADRLGLLAVATAHTADDQAETVLLRVIRGSGVGGLAGIRARRGVFVRPLLDESRASLRAYLKDRGIEWREDPTNEDLAIERNWIRREILPRIVARRPGAAATIASLAGRAAGEDAVLSALAERALERCEEESAGVLVPDDALAPAAVGARVVATVLRRMGARTDRRDIARVMALGDRAVTEIDARTIAVRTPRGVAVLRVGTLEPVALPASGTLGSDAFGVRVRVGDAAVGWRWRTSAPSGVPLVLRSRRPGDRVPTARGVRDVRDVLSAARVPIVLRDRLPILASDDRALAVVGLTSVGSSDATSRTIEAEPLGSGWWREDPQRWKPT